MDEAIDNAQQAAERLVRDLELAYTKSACCNNPAGPTRGDRALSAFLIERMAEARKLYSDLLKL